MVNKEILLVADVFANEKDIDKDVVFEALELALAAAAVKRHENQIGVWILLTAIMKLSVVRVWIFL